MMIDWSLVIVLLKKYYGNADKIAKESVSDWQHIGRLARGEVNEPRFNTGIRLLDLLAKHAPEHECQRVILNKSAFLNQMRTVA
jgi:hypothetical protein